MPEHPSEVVVAARVREYLRNRLVEATRVLSEDSSRLAKLLIEMLEIATEGGNSRPAVCSAGGGAEGNGASDLLKAIYLSGINEAGKSIAEPSEGTQPASTAASTALPSAISKIRRALPSMHSAKYRVGFRRGTRRGLWLFL